MATRAPGKGFAYPFQGFAGAPALQREHTIKGLVNGQWAGKVHRSKPAENREDLSRQTGRRQASQHL
jgi:hypothetical protein